MPMSCRFFLGSVMSTTKWFSLSLKMQTYLARQRSRRMLVTKMRCSSSRLTRGVPPMYGIPRGILRFFCGQTFVEYTFHWTSTHLQCSSLHLFLCVFFSSGVLAFNANRNVMSTLINAIGNISGDLKFLFREFVSLGWLYASNDYWRKTCIWAEGALGETEVKTQGWAILAKSIHLRRFYELLRRFPSLWLSRTPKCLH